MQENFEARQRNFVKRKLAEAVVTRNFISGNTKRDVKCISLYFFLEMKEWS